MLKRFYYSLLKPTRIALYIKDKIILSFLYALFFIVLCSAPSIIKFVNSNNNISQSEIKYITNQIPENSGAKFNDNTFIVEKGFTVYDYDKIQYNFGVTPEIGRNNITFVFDKERLNVYRYGVIALSQSYKALNVENFSFDDINTNAQSFYSFKNLYSSIYNNLFRENALFYSLGVIIDTVLTFLIVAVLLYIVTCFKNPFLGFNHRINLSIYSMTWTFIGIFIGNYFNQPIFAYIAAAISTFCLTRALSVIKVVQIPKGRV